ncbi:hypothetical protein K491DRAFT_775762 [Lophiostoma macrostomum CBS 122681]|uniref:Uncharacterized protein n=1 Tax=Lophiostoma macrostomum CBS 122681 TaxID=1314788 RepID=A0A6A6TJE5_9PLEO|nr:hypothetical protein K491DRAFT_775762 [Lophiostoma macrostomum CBS 122681]
MQIVSALPDLPTEIIENVARGLDDDPTSWFAFRLTCCALCSKSVHPFGKRFFTTLKFCLHPISLQALTDISYNAEFASHVRNVAFGTEFYGLIDPLHDGVVKRAGLNSSTPTRHPPMQFTAMDTANLVKARTRTDSAIIAQALSKFPKLSLLMVGNDLELTLKDGHMVYNEYISLFEEHAERLRCVSLVNCTVVLRQTCSVLTASNLDTTAWLRVLWALTKLPHLVSLRLDHPRAFEAASTSTDNRFSQEDILIHSFEESMSFTATWEGTSQISTGLEYLIKTYQVSRSCKLMPGMRAGSFKVSPSLPGFLVLRWANSKADPACDWTQHEANVLYTRRLDLQYTIHDITYDKREQLHRLPIDDSESFPLEEHKPEYLFKHPFVGPGQKAGRNGLRWGVVLINSNDVSKDWGTIWFQDGPRPWRWSSQWNTGKD